MKYLLNSQPSVSHLQQIELWLVEEDRKFKRGFYCNWDSVHSAFIKKRLITFDCENVPIGFLVWRKDIISVELEIIEIHPDYRNKGIGTEFQLQIDSYFKSKRIKALTLHCSPPDSEDFVRRLGFYQYPNISNSIRELTFFKPLIKTEKLIDGTNVGSKIELWDKEILSQQHLLSNWCWSISINQNGELKTPILFPCHPDWTLRVTVENNVIFNDRVKLFNRKFRDNIYGDFLMLNKINI